MKNTKIRLLSKIFAIIMMIAVLGAIIYPIVQYSSKLISSNESTDDISDIVAE